VQVDLALARAGRHTVEATRQPLKRLTALSPLVQAGLLVLFLGAAGDLAYHALPATFEPLLGLEGYRAHLITFVGMLVMLVGVIRQGLSQPRSLVPRGGLSSHAHR
jgi:hypothetical protein